MISEGSLINYDEGKEHPSNAFYVSKVDCGRPHTEGTRILKLLYYKQLYKIGEMKSNHRHNI